MDSDARTRLERFVVLGKAASKGPWKLGAFGLGTSAIVTQDSLWRVARAMQPADAAFIAAAPQAAEDIAVLLAEGGAVPAYEETPEELVNAWSEAPYDPRYEADASRVAPSDDVAHKNAVLHDLAAFVVKRVRAVEGEKAKAQAGEVHPIDEAFHRLTVAQRDTAWRENERLTERLTILDAEKQANDDERQQINDHILGDQEDHPVPLFVRLHQLVTRLTNERDHLAAEHARVREALETASRPPFRRMGSDQTLRCSWCLSLAEGGRCHHTEFCILVIAGKALTPREHGTGERS